MSWGYRHGVSTFAQSLQSGKRIVNTNQKGTKIYKSIIGEGIGEIIVYWHDNRKTTLDSKLIIRMGDETSCYDVSHLKTQKDIFQFAVEQLIKLRYVSIL